MKSSKFILLSLVFLLVASPVWALDGVAGLGVGMAPDYEGSDDTTAVPMFMFQQNYDSGRFVKLMGTNLKVNLLADKQFNLGPVLNYHPERGDVDNNRVDAMKNVDAAIEAGVFGGVNIDNLSFGLEFLADVSGEHDGWTAKANAGYRWRAMPELTLTPGVFATYADNDYMETYFGVDSSDASRSGLPYYSAGKGFKDVGINLVAHYTPWEKWGIMGIASYKALLNDAKHSPIVEDEGNNDQVTLGLMATYRWK